ncbi:UNVERIFIED_CONTAM: hypothetical protein HDU68_001115 [Siphonaria sp. JEL0065]|nr:hypothetical protein HDU68_001115 [Siphonaria sp. JEL0065]
MAFDPIQSNSAVSLSSGRVLVSNPTSSTTLTFNEGEGAVQATFVAGTPLLLVLCRSTLSVFNLATNSLRKLSLPFSTCFVAIPKSSFVFVGLESGDVICVDSKSDKGSSYAVPAADLDSKGSVAGLSLDEGNVLAVAHDSQVVSLWLVKERHVAALIKLDDQLVKMEWIAPHTLLICTIQSISVWTTFDATAPENGVKSAAKALFKNIKQTFAKETTSLGGEHEIELIGEPAYTIPIPHTNGKNAVIHDFCIVYDGSSHNICIAWSIAAESYVSLVSFSPPSTPKSTIAAIHNTSTQSIHLNNTHITRVSLFSPSILLVTTASSFDPLLLINHNGILSLEQPNDPESQIPASLLIHTLPRVLGAQIVKQNSQLLQQQPMASIAGKKEAQTVAITAHLSDSCLRVWELQEPSGNVSKLIDKICVKDIVPFVEPPNDAQHEEGIGSGALTVGISFMNSDGMLAVWSGAILGVFEQCEEEGTFDFDEGVMDELDRVVDQVIGKISLDESVDVDSQTDQEEQQLEPPKIIKQITSLQLQDLEADTPPIQPEPEPTPKQSSSKRNSQNVVQHSQTSTEEHHFVKNNTALVSFIGTSATTPQECSPKWKGILQIMASGVIEVSTISPNSFFLAFSTAYGDMTLIDMTTGFALISEQFGSQHDQGSRIASIHFETTFFNRDGQTPTTPQTDAEHYWILGSPCTSTISVFLAQPGKPTRLLIQKRSDGTEFSSAIGTGAAGGGASEAVLGWVGKLFAKSSSESLKASSVDSLATKSTKLVSCGLVRGKRGEPLIVSVHEGGFVVVLGVPELQVVDAGGGGWGKVGGVVSGREDSVTVFGDASVGVWKRCENGVSVSREWDVNGRVFGGIAGGSLRLYDFLKQNRYWKDVASATAVEVGIRDRELDSLFKGQHQDKNWQELMSGSTLNSSQEPSSSSSTANAFQETKNKLNERGEMLSNMERKFADLDRGASDFLNTIKEYNARQEKKKWYEL